MAGPTAPTTAPTAIRAGGPLLSPVRRNIIFTALVFGVHCDRPNHRCARIADDRRRAGQHR